MKYSLDDMVKKDPTGFHMMIRVTDWELENLEEGIGSEFPGIDSQIIAFMCGLTPKPRRTGK